jgi:hypothetical protein
MSATPAVLAAYGQYTEARAHVDVADAIYSGNVGEPFSNRRVARLLAKAGINTIEDFAYASIPVNVIARSLRLLEPAVLTESGEPDQATTQVLLDIMDDNELGGELNSLFGLVSRHGDAYLLVWPVEDEQGNATGVDVMVESAETTHAVYDEERPLKIKYVVKIWEDQTEHTRLNLTYPDHVERWILDKGGRPDNPDAWQRHPDHPDDIPTPDGVLPYFHLRNDRPYGTPEHAAAYGPQRMINKLVSGLGAITDYQIAPQRYYMADPTNDDPTENLLDPDYPEDDDDDPEGPTKSPLSNDPSSVWKLYGRSAGQFNPADPDNLIKPMDRCIRSMSDLTSIPAYYFGWGTGKTPSGAALRTLDAPRVNIVNDRKTSYTPTLKAAFTRALLLAGHPDARVAIRWQPSFVVTDLEGWQIVAAKIAVGMPVDVALTEAGCLPEAVASWIASANGDDPGRRLDLLQQLSTIVQVLSGGQQPATAAPTKPSGQQQPQPAVDTSGLYTTINDTLQAVAVQIAAGTEGAA